jgi:hypothetical protein
MYWRAPTSLPPDQEQSMADPMDKAEKAFKKEERRREGVKNMADYEQAAIAERKKTARLRELRLAHEAQQAQAEAAAATAKPAAKKKSVKKAGKSTVPAAENAQ